MLATPKCKGELFLASSLCDGLEDSNIEQVKTLLVNKEADPNVLIPTHGITPFHLVIGNDSEQFAVDVTKLFLRHGGNPNVRSADGLTPVHVAAAWGRIDILELLLLNGGDPLCVDNDGQTPFHYAFDNKYYKAITTLGKYCGNILDQDERLQYKLSLERILINSRDVAAEYVVSQQTTMDSKNILGEQPPSHQLNDSLDSQSKDSTTTAVYKSPCLFSDKITFRQYHMDGSKNNESEYNQKYGKSKRTKDVKKYQRSVNKRMEQLSISSNVESTINGTMSSDAESTSTVNDQSSSYDKSNANPEICSKNSHKYTVHGVENDAGHYDHISSPRNYVPRRNYIKPKYASQNRKEILPRAPEDTIISGSPNFARSIRTSKKENTSVLPLNTSDKYPLITATNMFTPPKAKHTPPQTSKFNNYFRTQNTRSTPRRKRDNILYTPVNKCNHIGRSKDSYTSNRQVTDSKKISTINNKRFMGIEKVVNSGGHSTSDFSPEFQQLYGIQNRKYSPNKIAVKLDDSKYDEDVNAVLFKDSNSCITEPNISKLANAHLSDRSKLENSYDYSLEANNCTSFLQRESNDLLGIPNANKNAHITSDNFYLINQYKMEDEFSIKSPLVEITNNKRFLEVQQVKSELHDSPYQKTSNANLINNANLEFKNIREIFKEDNLFRERNIYENITTKLKLNDSDNTEEDKKYSSLETLCTSYISIEKQYKYEDPEEGVIFLERRYCVTPSESEDKMYLQSSDIKRSDVSDLSQYSGAQALPSVSLPKELLLLDNNTIRERLTDLGCIPGPITNTTKQVYIKCLMRLEHTQKAFPKMTSSSCNETEFDLNKIQLFLRFGSWVNNLKTYKSIEQCTFKEFSQPDPSRKWREGTTKTSFNYLLLDARITQNLPYRYELTESQIWHTFLAAIFYVGKGKRSRPYAHLYDAFHTWVSKDKNVINKKIKRIHNIWDEGQGVVCLHVFQNTIPVEAYTREAAMIDALGTEHLGNSKGGEYYGLAATWSNKDKCKFGRYLLYVAMQIFMHEGERQLFPEHL